MAITDKLSAIAEAIRSKTSSTELMTLAQMPSLIESISGGGYDFIENATTGTITIPRDISSSSITWNYTHNFGYLPDIFLIYKESWPSTSNFLVSVCYMPYFYTVVKNAPSHSIKGVYFYKSTGTSSGGGSFSSSTAPLTLTDTTITFKFASSNYSWKTGKYNYIAIKFKEDENNG